MASGARCVTWDSMKQTQCVDNLATPMPWDMNQGSSFFIIQGLITSHAAQVVQTVFVIASTIRHQITMLPVFSIHMSIAVSTYKYSLVCL